MAVPFKVESGLQLLARLSKKRTLESFYPTLFCNGPGFHQVIEVCGCPGAGKSFLLGELVTQALVPEELGGLEASVILFNTDGNFSLNLITELLVHKLQSSLNEREVDFNRILKESLQRLHIVEIYDATQFYVTIQNLETFLVEYPQVSLIALDTLTAYYWSEQTAKFIKMGTYIKNILKLIQKVTKDFKVAIMYTRQEYFDSNRDITDLENIHYRIYIQKKNIENEPVFEATVITNNCKSMKYFKIISSILIWVTF